MDFKIKFKEEINKWFGPKSKCSLGSYIKPALNKIKFALGEYACLVPFRHKILKIELN